MLMAELCHIYALALQNLLVFLLQFMNQQDQGPASIRSFDALLRSQTIVYLGLQMTLY